jgi:hypothetical protein
LALAVSLLSTVSVVAASTTIWGIYFTTPWMPGGDGVLLTPAGPGETISGVKPCTHKQPTYPWDQCRPITIIGYDIIHQVSDQTVSSWMIVGSGHAGDGADVFAMTAGRGTTAKGMMFPSGVGIKQGPVESNPGYAHIDVYGSCDAGEQRGIISIYYTSP